MQVSFASKLESFAGLTSLESIAGDFDVKVNGSLASFAGLDRLRSIGGSLNVLENQRLSGLDGLEALESVGGNVNIRRNPALENIAGLAGLAHLRGDLTLFENPALVALGALQKLTTVAGLEGVTELDSLEISANRALSNLDGLSGLTKVEGGIKVSANEALVTRLEGLAEVELFGADWAASVTVSDNALLESFAGFPAAAAELTHPGLAKVEELRVLNNEELSTCDVRELQERLNPAAVQVSGNASCD